MTRHRSISTILGTLAIAAGLVMTFASPASARIVEREVFHDEFSGTIEDFCDVEGLDVDFEGTVDGRFQVNDRGPGGLDYFLEKTTVVRVFTDQATGQHRHRHPAEHHRQGPFELTDNGDGTITIIALLTGGQRTTATTAT